MNPITLAYITPAQLSRAFGVRTDIANCWAPLLIAAAQRWQIDTPLRRAAWLAQLAHESRGFTVLRENLIYRSPSRIVAVWPTRFREAKPGERADRDRFADGRLNAGNYVAAPLLLAGAVYDGRADLGNTQPGDGARYLGRGLMQITGRANYQAYQDATGRAVVTHPELLEQPDVAADAAGWFWSTHGCNPLADQGMTSFESVCRRINPGDRQSTEARLVLYQAAIEEWAPGVMHV